LFGILNVAQLANTVLPGHLGLPLRALLVDERGRTELLQRSAAFMARYRVVSDGSAARRAVERIVGLVSGTGGPPKVF